MDKAKKWIVIAGLVAVATVARGEEKTAPGQVKENGSDKKDAKENAKAKDVKKDDGKVADPTPTLNELDFIVLWAQAAKANRVTKDQDAQCKEVVDAMREKFYSNIDKWTWADFMARMKVLDDLRKIDKVHGPNFVWRPGDSSPFVSWCGKSKNQAELLARICELSKRNALGSDGYKYMIAQFMENQRIWSIDKSKNTAWLKNFKSAAPACCHKAIDDLMDD